MREHDERSTTTPRRHWRRAGAAVALTALVLAGCGDDDSVDPGQPNASGGFQGTEIANVPPSGGSDAAGGSGEVPVPKSAVSTGPATQQNGTTTESFLVQGVTPTQLIKDYQTLAEGEGWTVEQAAAQSGTSDWTLAMANGSSTLQVTAAPANTGGQSDQTQLSLQVSSD